MVMSKITKIALLIKSSQANNRDFLFRDIPSNRLANLLLFSECSENLSASLEKAKRIMPIIRATHPINTRNATEIEIILLVSEISKWYISDTEDIRIN